MCLMKKIDFLIMKCEIKNNNKAMIKKYFWKIIFAFLMILSFSYHWFASDDFKSIDFTIDIKDFTGMWKDVVSWWTLDQKANNFFWEIIDILLSAVWVIALFVMVVWAWFMVFYNWQDEMLKKWKNLFMWWILWLVIALTSYYIIALIKYFIYQ